MSTNLLVAKYSVFIAIAASDGDISAPEVSLIRSMAESRGERHLHALSYAFEVYKEAVGNTEEFDVILAFVISSLVPIKLLEYSKKEEFSLDCSKIMVSDARIVSRERTLLFVICDILSLPEFVKEELNNAMQEYVESIEF